MSTSPTTTSRNFNEELKDTADRTYSYNFDFDVMHPYMLESFKPFFRSGNMLELGCFRGAFTRRLDAIIDHQCLQRVGRREMADDKTRCDQ